MKLRLSYLIDVLPKYNNNFKKGCYKSGNYKGVRIMTPDSTFNSQVYDVNEIPKELFESPWYVKSIYPFTLSADYHNVNCGICILLGKEENKYGK